jgi:hypothetical protein
LPISSAVIAKAPAIANGVSTKVSSGVQLQRC